MKTGNNCGSYFELRDNGIQHCRYCGSITPAALIHFMKQPGTRYSGSDWKYGWPHKFYIEPVNPNPKLVVIGTSSDGDGTSPMDYWSCRAHPNYSNNIEVIGDDPKTATIKWKKDCSCPIEKATGYWNRVIQIGRHQHLYCKFYNNHLHDATPEEFKELREISVKFFGIDWDIVDGKLRFMAPKTNSFYGHQQAGDVADDGSPKRTF